MRVIVMELARITDHVILQLAGALIGFLYKKPNKRTVYEIYEEICGARSRQVGRIGVLVQTGAHWFFFENQQISEDFPAIGKNLKIY
jgi:NADH:ubiquinone oxidoreductase subunit D